jgi:hypothetical protein
MLMALLQKERENFKKRAANAVPRRDSRLR